MTEIPNIILLTVDALRADHLSHHGYERNTSPFVDELAQDELNFETAISASSHTREALPAILSGHHGDTFAANDYRYATDTVADKLSKQGYQTGGFHSNPYVSRAYGYDSGFDTFDDDLRLGQNRYIALFQRALDKFLLNKGEYHARAETINQRSLEWLDSIEGHEPFFLWNHYMDVHGPYNPPEEYDDYSDRPVSNAEAQRLYQKCINSPDAITESERELLVDLYDGEIRYLDEQLREFVSELEGRGLLDDALLILTSDHGDAFGEHGYYTHPRRLANTLLHVPMIISHPAGDSATTQTPVSTLQIAPTILEFIGAASDEFPYDPLLNEEGKLAEELPDAVFSSATGEDSDSHVRRFAIQDARKKIIMERDIKDGTELSVQGFDLKQDPGEQDPIDDLDDELAGLRDRLRSFSSDRLGSVDQDLEQAEPDSEIEDRLEALGYK